MECQQHFAKWVKLLVKDNPNNEKRYKELLKRYDSVGVAVMGLRMELLKNNTDISKEGFIGAYGADKEHFRGILSELFLEYIDMNQLDNIIKIMDRKNISAGELYDRHMKNRNARVLRLLA